MIGPLTADRRLTPDFSVPLFLLVIAALVLPWLAMRIAYAQYARVLVAVILVADMCITYAWWRVSVYLLLGYILIEGFLINAFSMPELNLLKDAQIGLLCLRLATSTIARRIFPIPRADWVVPFLLFAMVYTAEIFNPNLPSILIGLVGMRVTLEFSVCFVIGYWFFNDSEQVLRFLHFHNWLSLPISAFGIVQYFTGPELLLRISPGFARAIFYAFDASDPSSATYFRTISTFASTSGFSLYLWIAAILTLTLMLVSTRPSDKVVCRVALLMQACALLTTGCRGPFVLLFAAVFLGFTLMRRLRQAFAGALILIVFFTASTLFLGERVERRFATLLDFEMIRDRNSSIGLGEIEEATDSPIVGYGAGMGCAASSRVFPDLVILGSENQFARIRYEAGLAGLVLFLGATIILFLDTVRKAISFRDPRFRTIGCLVASIPLISMLTFAIGMPLDVPPINFYFWFLIGLLQALLRIETAEAQARTAADTSPLSPA
ncbi:MAG TPA: hypothetical protein VJX29_02575 [Candidatus Acidoferrales bacterium]|nr:hypothetical protein [Candidatus Acidoferrales bacterium]